MTIDLTQLNDAEKRRLLDQLSYELSAGKEPPSVIEQEVFNALYAALGHSYPSQPFTSFVQAYGRNKYRNDASEALDILRRSCAVTLRRSQRAELLRMAFECLVELMQSWEPPIPITAAGVLKAIKYLPAALDRAYPGYASSRLLHKLVPLHT